MREPRSQTIARHVREALRHSGLTEQSLAAEVVEQYHRRTSLHERNVEFHSGTTTKQIDEAQRANAQLLRRMFGGLVRMPADLEESIVLALPEPYRRRLLRELAGRHGLLAVPMPSADCVSQHQALADLAREFGEAVEKVSPMLADGKIDASDAAHAPAAIRELEMVGPLHDLGKIVIPDALLRKPGPLTLEEA